MAEVGQIEYIARIDTNQMRSDASRANKIARSTGDKFSSSFTKATAASKALTASVALAGAAVTAAFGKFVIGGGISRALNIEDAQAKLRGLGHDVKSVEKIMDSALASVKGTAFGLDAAATIAASAVAAGIKPGQELTKYLGLTADAATIAGVSLSEMGSIFNKVQTGQRAYTQELNQLADRGIPIYQWLQQELDITQDALREMVANGELDSATYFSVIQKNIGGAALESGKTTRGAWANMQAAMARVGAAIVADIIPKVREAFGSMTAWFDANSDRIVAAVGRITSVIGSILGAVTQILPVEGIIYAITGAITVGMIPAFIALGVAIWGALAPILPFLAAGAALGALAYFIKERWATIGPIVNTVINTFRSFWNTIKPIREFIVGQFMAAWRDLQAAFIRVRDALAPFAPQLQFLAKIVLAALLIPIGLAILKLVALVAAVTIVITVVARLIGWIAQLGSRFMALASTMIQSIANGVSGVINYFKALPGRILGAFSGLGSLLYNSGRSLIEGFGRGIRDAAGAVVNAAKDVVGKVRDFFPFSPAKTGPFSGRGWTEYSGAALIDGFAKGIKNKNGVVGKAVSNTIGSGFDYEMNTVGSSSMNSLSNDTFPSNNQTQQPMNVYLEVKMDGVMTRSKADERQIIKEMLETVNQEMRAKQLPEIGGGALGGRSV